MSEIKSNVLSQSPQKLEEKILKAIFKRNSAILDVVEIIDRKMFTINDYANIYTSMIELYKKDNTITAETVQIWLENNGVLVDNKIIKKLYNESYTSLKVAETAKILKELYQRRFMLESIREVIEKQEQSPTDSVNILEQINNIAMKSNDTVANENKDTKCCSDTNEILKEIELKLSNKFEEEGINVSIPVIDNELGGLKRGKLFCVVADSQVGKSQMAIQLATKACLSQPDLYVDYYSLEMTKSEVELRVLSVLTDIEPRYIENPQKYFTRFDEQTGKFRNYYQENKNSKLVQEYKSKIRNGVNILNKLNFYVDDTPDLDTVALEARIKKNNLKRGRTDIIVIDHVGIACSGSPSEVVGKMDELYNKLKQIAKKFNCIVIALHQFSKELKNDPLHKPNVFALRGSSAPLHYSDVIMGIWRPCVYTDVMDVHPELKDVCELSWQKVRYTNKPDNTAMTYNGYLFKEKQLSDTGKEIVAGNVYLDSNGEII